MKLFKLFKSCNIRQITKRGLSKIQILSSGYPDRNKCCTLIINDDYYLINAGEGTNRLLKHEKIPLNKLRQLMLTRADWRTLGGLVSLSIGLNRLKRPLYIHSPINWNLEKHNSLIQPFIHTMSDKKFNEYKNLGIKKPTGLFNHSILN